MDILKLQNISDSEDIIDYMSTIDLTTIISELHSVLGLTNSEIIIQTLLNSFANGPSQLERKLQVVQTILREVEEANVSDRVAEKLINILSGDIDSFPTNYLIKLVDICCNMIKQPSGSTYASWRELLPRLMQLLVAVVQLEHAGTQMSGEDYKSSIITLLCMTGWSDKILVNIASMFADMPLSKDERSRVVRKLCHRLEKSPLDQIPPLCHQMVVLTRNGESITFLLALADYFNTNLYRSSDYLVDPHRIKEMSDVEGTVLYHIVNDMGPGGVKDLIKTLKGCQNSPENVLRPFSLTLLLALSSYSSTAESEILTLLRYCLTRVLAEKERTRESLWLQSVSPAPLDVEQLLSQVQENCFRGRYSVLKGLISLAFCVLGGPRPREAADRFRAIGASIVEDLVRRHRLVTAEVLETLAHHISQATDPLHYMDCLLVLSRKQPLHLLDCSNLILQLVDNMCAHLPGPTVSQAMRALLPLARLSQPVRDRLVIVLRKSLFSHDLERRIMAVKGFLELLRNLKISNLQSLSQSMSQNYCNFTQLCSQSLADGASQSNEGLCLEVLAILREVFKQQHQVKNVLYTGIYLSIRVNPELGSHVLDYLPNHVEKYIQPSDVAPPLFFEKAVVIRSGEVILQEPLGQLILSLALLVTKLEESSRTAKWMEQLDLLCTRMSSCDVASFSLEMEDGSCILEPITECQQKQEILRQALLVYEALMGYTLCAWKKETSIDKPTMLWSLFRGFTCLSDYAKGLGKSDKKKDKGKSKGKPLSFKFPGTVFNLKCCSRLLDIINGMPVDWAIEASTLQLRGKRELHRYAVQMTNNLLNDLKAMTPSEISRGCLHFGYLCKIARTIYTKCVSKLIEMKAFDLPTAVGGLQCFSDLLALILSHFKSKFPHFLCEITAQPLLTQISTFPLEIVLNSLLDQLSDVLSEEDQEEEAKEDLQSKKMSLLFLAVISTLVSQLPPQSAFLQTVHKMLAEECRIRVLEKSGVVKALLSLVLSLDRRCQQNSSILQDFTLCLCSCMPLIDGDIILGEHVKYKVINTKTGNVSITAVCDALMSMISDIGWFVNRLKSELVSMSFPSKLSVDERRENLRQRERELCQHVIECVKVLSALCTIAVPPGVFTDPVLKCLELTYSKLTLLTKYFYMKVTKYKESLVDVRFDKMVKIVDAELTKNMYCFTEHVIADGSGDISGVNPSLLKQRTLKETKLIPRVVLEKEQYHKFLLQLSKRAKMDLAARTKHAITRDYRLYTRRVKEMLDRPEPQSDSMEVEEEMSPPSSPNSKRVRTSSQTSSTEISSQCSSRMLSSQ